VSDVSDTTVSDHHDPHSPSVTPVPIPVARLSDPHLQASTRHPRRVEGIVAFSFIVGIAGVVAFGAAYWQNATPWIFGVSLGVGLFFLGFGLTAWGKYLMPAGPFVEDRHPLASSKEDQDAMAGAIVERTQVVVRRRWLLGGLLGTGFGIFGIVAMFPLLRSLGPVPGNSLDVTNWGPNVLIVDADGRPIHVDDVEVGGIVTVFPRGYQPGGVHGTPDNQQIDQTVVIRLQDTDVVTQPGRESWGPQGYVAFSKLCTHLGCPVGLYEQQLELLVCPCHQSMFKVAAGSEVVFGPAPRPLPQLPLTVDSAGYLRSQAGYDQPVGPGFWERS
jgi:ubiquinol-cytochrome c reductase iron-sulfur subunit